MDFKIKKNKFGVADVVTAVPKHVKIYIECSACMSIYAEALSWTKYLG